jgi:hypothetical protein
VLAATRSGACRSTALTATPDGTARLRLSGRKTYQERVGPSCHPPRGWPSRETSLAATGPVALSGATWGGTGYLPLATGLTPHDARSSRRSPDAGRQSRNPSVGQLERAAIRCFEVSPAHRCAEIAKAAGHVEPLFERVPDVAQQHWRGRLPKSRGRSLGCRHRWPRNGIGIELMDSQQRGRDALRTGREYALNPRQNHAGEEADEADRERGHADRRGAQPAGPDGQQRGPGDCAVLAARNQPTAAPSALWLAVKPFRPFLREATALPAAPG